MAKLYEGNRLLKMTADTEEDKRLPKTEDNYLIKQEIEEECEDFKVPVISLKTEQINMEDVLPHGSGGTDVTTGTSYNCTICTSLFPTQADLEQHLCQKMKRFSNPYRKESQTYVCHICGSSFSRLSHFEFMKHLQGHPEYDDPNQCKKCGKRFSRIKLLLKHHCSYNCGTCDTCGRSFNDKDTFSEHVQFCNVEKLPYPCKECNRRFANLSSLFFHLKRFHKNAVQAVDCFKGCGKTFSKHGILLKHMNMHHPEDFHESCKICGQEFTDKFKFTEHINTLKVCDQECKECGIKFPNLQQLNIHERSHTGATVYSCMDCGKCFITYRRFKEHTRKVHSKELPYKCEECGYRFSDQSILDRHHSETHVFQCQECDRKYTNKKNLALHMRLHTDDCQHPFECDECGLSFGREKILVKHKEIHSSGRTVFGCEVCNKSFFTKFHLKRHQAIHSRKVVKKL